ncbi:MAG: histidine kinase [Bacteroidetes bacterium]|nr:histidine kinase [Bacteroidota bacterium]
MKKNMRLLVLLLMAPVVSLSLTNADSLKRVLQRTVPDSLVIENNLQLFKDLPGEDHDAKMVLAEWLVSACVSSKNYEGLAHSYLLIGHYVMERQQHSEAMRYFTDGLRIAERIKSYYLMGRFYNALGVISYEFGNKDQAIEHIEKAIEYTLKADDKIMLGSFYHNLAGMYFENSSGNADTAAMAIQMGLSALELQMQEHDTLRAINTKNGLAFMYSHSDQYDQAIRQLDECQELIELTGADLTFVTHYMRYGQIYVLNKEYEKAITYLDKGMPYVKKFDAIRWEYNYYRYYALAHAGLGNYKKSNDYNEKYITIRDSIITLDNYAKANEIQERYESEKKEKEILQLNKDNEINQLRIEQEEETQFILKIIIASAILVLVILLTLTIFLVRINISRRRINTELTIRNQEIKEQSGRLSNQARLISKYQSQMNPHFVFNALNGIQGMVISEQKSSTVEQLQKLSALMRITLRNSDREFIPLNEETDYLKRYLEFEQVKFPQRIEFTIQLPEHFDEILVPPMLIQPFIENAVKHAALHTVTNPEIKLSVSINTNFLKIEITDNGIGFNNPKLKLNGETHALSIIASRMEMIWKTFGEDGPEKTVSIRSKPVLEVGTVVEIILPLHYKF